MFTPYATNKLIKATNAIWRKEVAEHNEKNAYFPYIDSDLGDFALIMTSGLRIKEFPLYGTDNYYKMVGKRSIQKIFFRIERFPFHRSSLFGICTVASQNDSIQVDQKVLYQKIII